MSWSALRSADEAVAGLVDKTLASYIDWREAAAAARDAYGRWCEAPTGKEDRTFSEYTAALDQEESAAARYALVLELVQRSLGTFVAARRLGGRLAVLRPAPVRRRLLAEHRGRRTTR